jgi:hypothetical protein
VLDGVEEKKIKVVSVPMTKSEGKVKKKSYDNNDLSISSLSSSTSEKKSSIVPGCGRSSLIKDDVEEKVPSIEAA